MAITVRSLLSERYRRRSAAQGGPAAAAAAAAAAAPATGWVSYTTWSNQSANPITKLDTTWIVPPNPSTQAGQILYLFNSLEIPGSYILQPVLSWGTVSDVPGSGDFWTIASWYVGSDNNPFYLTELIRVDPGDRVTGRITMYQQEQPANGPVYDYTCEFVGKAGTKLFVGAVPLLTDCTETLETYNITTDSDYPDNTAQTAFSAIVLEVGGAPAQFTWTPSVTFPPTVAAGGTEVDIVYPRGET
jgi:hypothetical protein